MKKMTFGALAAAAMLLLLVTPSAEAQYCAPDQSPGPPVAYELLSDTSFDHNCALWQYTGAATRIGTGRRYVEIDGSGLLLQTVPNPGTLNGTWSLDVYVDTIGGTSTGSERLRIEILDDWGNVAETVDYLAPTAADGWHNYIIGNYSNIHDFTVRLWYVPGANASGTSFEISDVVLWAGI